MAVEIPDIQFVETTAFSSVSSQYGNVPREIGLQKVQSGTVASQKRFPSCQGGVSYFPRVRSLHFVLTRSFQQQKHGTGT